MANERLRAALLQRGAQVSDLAEATGVDPKTVERWITQARTPYRRHRFAVAAFLGMEESYLWPEALSREQVAAASESEVVTLYPHRWAVPRDAWGRLFGEADQEIGVLVYSGMFLADDAGMVRLFGQKADAGTRVRILLGDPECPEVAQRGADEGIDDGMAAKIRNVLVLYRPLIGRDNVEIRLHDTVLYNSIYRGDDQLLINTHIYGTPAGNAPVLHLRKVVGGDMVATYLDSFERIWTGARPVGS
ncbi:helix-turn-helix transcriptional regulator [Spongiactinospora sp. TRM90649]|uniref:helix-turn-helix domain-containing protein n=1 Tax=Spongiactinospora sp. TRM90649 TaxID=3031114 RepID=UPI0023F89F80|nr:helix-turn-helix transcriptional regulator [Spongiactinospora sp. TRM90649]MDF5751691.1 helix-turn-helix transcriptional regulator [Spongiactinospora sp. TRM90649]